MAKKKAADAELTEEVFVYLGPSIRGVIQHGSIYRGTRGSVELRLFGAIAKYPDIRRLIISAEKVSAIKEKIKKGVGAEYNAYRRINAAKEVTC